MTLTDRRSTVLAVLVALLAGCAAAPTATPALTAPPSPSGPRPSSTASLMITAPTDGATVTGPTVHIAMTLTGATITAVTTTNISPDQGHIHLYVDNVIRSMNYSTEEDLQLSPGTYDLKAEFVASDHVPFAPRVWSNEVVFTVQ
jgi:hypothetical protein